MVSVRFELIYLMYHESLITLPIKKNHYTHSDLKILWHQEIFKFNVEFDWLLKKGDTSNQKLVLG